MEEAVKDTGTLSRSIHSGKWMMISMVIQKVLTLATFFVLARFLKPVDYGIIAILLMVTAVTNRLTSHGLSAALLQRGGDIDPYLDPIWTINIFKSLSLAVLIFFIAGPVSVFFNIPQSLPLLRLGGLLLIFPSLSNARQVYLFTNLDFKKIFWRDLSGQISYSVVSIIWALFISANAWALLAGQFSRVFVSSSSTYFLYRSSPRLSFNFAPLKKLFNYSKWIIGQDMLDYFNSLIDQFFVGHLLGAEKLGFYSKAYDLASVTRASLLSIIGKVGFYSYNIVQKDLKKIQEGFIKSLDIMLTLAIPFSFLVIVEGGALVSVLLGNNWLSLVVPFKILAVANIFIAIYGVAFPIFNSIGRPDINFKMTMANLFLSLPLLYFGIKFWGVNGAAAVSIIVDLILLLYVIWQIKKVLHMGYEKVLSSFYHIALSMAPIIFLAIGLRSFMHSFGNDFLIFAWVAFLSMLYTLFFWQFGRWFPAGPRSTVEVIFSEITSNWRS